MELIYNKHFIRIDERNRIIYGFSDVFEQPQDGDILHNEQGGRHFQLRIKNGTGGIYSEENPQLRDNWGVPMYVLDGGGMAAARSQHDMEADRPEPQEPQLTAEEMLAAIMEGYLNDE